jgi:hypothetical protein
MLTRGEVEKMGCEALFIHYSESGDVDAEDIDYWHSQRFPDSGSRPLRYIGYHFVIRRNGVIERGRDINIAPMHCPGYNRRGVVAVVLTGSDSEAWYPAQTQYLAAAALIDQFQPRDVWLHKEKYSTSCPGSKFSKPYLLSLVGKEEEEDMTIYQPRQTKDQDGKRVFKFDDAVVGNGWLTYYNYYNEDGPGLDFEVYTSERKPVVKKTVGRGERWSLDLRAAVGQGFSGGFAIIVKTTAPDGGTVTVLKG